jgi:uncharacterized SAM-binding protein YcdF (DUF218 family)
LANAPRETWRPSAIGLAVGGLIGLLGHELDLRVFLSYWRDELALVVAAAIVGALLWRTRLKPLLTAVAALLALVWMAAAFSPLCAWLGRDLVRRDPLASADAVFVLSSNVQSDGDLTSASMSRLLHGLELLAQGQAPRLVLSELPPPIPPYAAPAKELIRQLEIEGEVLVVGPVRNTRDEAVAVARLFRERGWRKLLLVTSPSHSRRASAAFEREGLEVVSSPCMEVRFDLERLDTPRDRLAAFPNLMHERIGLWIYERRGWITTP